MEKADGHNEQWVDKKLIELADYWNGMAFKPSDWSDDGVKIIRIEQLNNPLGDYDHYKGSFPEINAIHDGDLIFSWSATLKVAIWKWGDGVLNQHLFKVVPFEKIDKHFLYFLLDYNMPKLGESSHGSTMKHIKRKELETYSVSIPDSLPAQRRIAAILSAADKVIEQTRQFISKYKSIKQGMMEDLLKPKEGWKKVKLGECCITELGKTLDEGRNTGEYRPYLCALNVLWGKIDITTIKQMRIEDDELNRYAVKKGDLLVCEGGEIGRCAIWDSDDIIYYQNALHRVRFFNGYDSMYFMYLLCYYNDLNLLEQHGKGLTIKHLNQTSFRSIPVSVPDLPEQRRIAKILSGIDKKIGAEEKVLEKYEKMKKGLMEGLLGEKHK